ncbi:MAG: hypothetical protein ACKO2K_03380, partial [Alphaproteobacteria bacterium]
MTGMLVRVLLAVGVVALLRRLFVGYRHRPLDAVCLSSLGEGRIRGRRDGRPLAGRQAHGVERSMAIADEEPSEQRHDPDGEKDPHE